MRPTLLLALLASGCLPAFPEKRYADDPADDFDGDGVTESDGDCDDSRADVAPGLAEVCDGRDNDCNSIADDDPTDPRTWFRDADLDGFGNDALVVTGCTPGEGYVAEGGDCDDGSATVFPGAVETCSPQDDNCDGELTPDPGAELPAWYLDRDRDGFGDDATSVLQCDAPAGYASVGGDCDDQSYEARPFGRELCDGLDNDCDDLIDDADPDAAIDFTWYADTDGDGFGGSATTTQACDAPTGFVEGAGDCDDTRADVSPGAEEACDGIDQDCDGRVDDGVQGTFYADLDADGFGDPAGTAVEACAAPAGMTEDFTDCDDLDPDSFPGATETCDDADNDCDGRTDEAGALGAATWYADADADGYGDRDTPFAACTQPASYVAVAGDCNDGRADVSPAATESCRTGLDDDCDGDENDIGAIGCSTFWPDADADGFGDAASPGACTCTASAAYPARDAEDCDDARATVNPDQLEDCGTGFDDDCDADANDAGAAGCTYFYVDVDGDGFGDDALPDAASCTCEGAGYLTATVEGDCDDTDVRVSPAQSEVCGGGDEDCSGEVDDDATDATRWYRDSDGDRFGDSASSRLSCTTPAGYASVGADCDDGRSGVYPGRTEDCLTTFDDDCSGSDNDVGADACTTFYADSDSDGYGVASDRTCTCEADTSTVYSSRVTGDCLDSNAGVSPGDVELCSTTGIDDDCDGTADEENASGCTNYFYDYDGDGYGTTSNRCLCSPSGYYTAETLGDCDDADAGTSPAALNCGLLGTVSTSSAAAVVTGRTIYTMSGYGGSFYSAYAAIAALDYNRDGAMDVAVGSSGEDTTYTDAGAVYLWLNDGSGLTGTHAASSSGDASLRFLYDGLQRRCGHYLSAGDVDADGYDELLVGCAGGDSSYLLDDGLDGLGTVTPGTSGVVTYSGYPVAKIVGDLNSDGYADGLMAESESTYPGAATYLGWGSASGLTRSTLNISVASATDYNNYPGFARAVSADDIDGDGIDDLVTKDYDIINLYAGDAAFSTTRPFGLNHGFGALYTSVQSVGDVTGDGYADVAVGYNHYNGTNPYTGTIASAGAVWVFQGGVSAGGPALLAPSGAAATTFSSDYAWKMEGAVANTFLGHDTAPAGDIDADGNDDIIITSGSYYENTGYTYLLYGRLDTTGATYRATDADATFAGLREAVEPAGDVNADGYDDLWAGSDSLYLFHGTPR